MAKEKVMNSREFKRVLLNNGYIQVSVKGDHFKWYNDCNNNTIIFTKNLNMMIARRLVKEYNLNL